MLRPYIVLLVSFVVTILSHLSGKALIPNLLMPARNKESSS